MIKAIRTIWIFSLSFILVYGCSDSKRGTQEVSTGIEVRKTIIYVEDEQCEEVALFYHEMLGIPYLKNGEDYKWVEFETGACKLCIHHNNKGMKMPMSGTTHIVFYLDNQDRVKSLYEKLISLKYEMKEIGKTDKILKPGEISQLISWKTSKGESLTSFWCSDPVGNIVQIEPRHEE